MKRKKVNCLCRCTPHDGIISMNSANARHLYDEQLHTLLRCDNPGHIAAMALQTGNILYRVGRPHLALKLMRAALSHLIAVDEEHQRRYANEHYHPLNHAYLQWYMPWYGRVSEVDARLLAARLDDLQNEVNRHLGHAADRSRLRFGVHRTYEALFEDIYETWRQ